MSPAPEPVSQGPSPPTAVTAGGVGLHVERLGSGPPVMLVHGSVTGAGLTWRRQRPLAKRWTLLLPSRRGFGQSPPTERVDFETDKDDIAALLGDGAHLVGHSYGGVVSLLAAASRPNAVWSLTVIEPPAFAVGRGIPAVDAIARATIEHWRSAPRDPERFLRGFLEHVGAQMRLRSPLRDELRIGAELLLTERLPNEAEIPLEQLAAASFPKLVVSGDHHPGFEAVCDVLEDELHAERAVIPGGGHGVQQVGAPFNRRLESFLARASADRS